MKCPRCQFEVPRGAAFCPECGTGLSDVCPQCGILNAPAHKFCIKCGSPFVSVAGRAPEIQLARSSTEAERRQLTVMFCDLVGSTALSVRLDPEDLRDVIAAYHKRVTAVVRQFDGFVAQYMGDGVLAYFGFPQAHEDDAERAVRAALDIVRAVREIEQRGTDELDVRIGIASGLVVVGHLLGEASSQEHAVVGETPNLAARLQALAKPGTAVVSASTRRLLGNVFTLRDVGRHEVKGFTEPVDVWAVESAAMPETRFESIRPGRLTRFVGRENEIGLLLDRWNLAQEGQGQVVLLSGEPGIGKSRIVTEFRARLEVHRTATLRFQCSPYHVNSAFYPIITHLERVLQLAREETPEAKLDKLEAMVVGRFGRPRDEVWLIAAMLSIPVAGRYDPITLAPQKFKDETLRVLVDMVEAAAQQQPSVMLFEDAHWADPTTLEMLDLLLQRMRRAPLLLVITHRPEFSARWSHYDYVKPLMLAKLTRSQSQAMVSELVGGKALPPELLQQILGKTDGVPLFIEETTKSILESAALTDAGDRWEYAGAGGAGVLAIPVTLRDSLMARLDRLTPPVKEIAQIGAVIGREFSHRLLCVVASRSERELNHAVVQLVASGLAFQRGTPPDAVYTFKHSLVRDAAYDSVLRRRRRKLHEQIARVMEDQHPDLERTEPELLAHHYTESGELARAIPLWEAAGSLALSRMALAEAIAHLRKGLDLLQDVAGSAEREERELALRCLLGTAWIESRGWQAEEVWESLYPALASAMSLHRIAALRMILVGLFANVFCKGRIRESLRWLAQISDAAEVHRDADLGMIEHYCATCSYLFLGELESVRTHADQVLALYVQEQHGDLVRILTNDPRTVALRHAAEATWIQGYPEQAVATIDAAVVHARRIGHPFDLGWVLATGTVIFDYIDEPDEILRRAVEAERLGREYGLRFLTSFSAPVAYGTAWIRKGREADGIRLIQAALAIWEASGGGIVIPYVKMILAEGLAQRGDVRGALELIDESIAQIERPGWEERYCYAEVLRIKGWLLSRQGDVAGAERYYVASIDQARQQHAKSWELRSASSYARLLREQGRVKEARDLLAPVYGWFTEGFETRDLREAKALLDLLGEAAVG